MARLGCILMLMGVSFSRVLRQSFFERYTRLLMETSPEFLIHFLKIYRSLINSWKPCSAHCRVS